MHFHQKFRVAVLCAAIFIGLASTCIAQEIKPSVDDLAAGRKIYNFRCYFCHGYSGNAQTVAAEFLTPRPVDFTQANSVVFNREHIISTLKQGKPGTAMQSFRSVLTDNEMKLLADFVVDEFVVRKAKNTHYHTIENGWENHQRYQDAFPFATGEIPISRSWDALSKEQAKGKRLFLSSCIVCHDRADKLGEKIIWESRPLSYPRNDYSPNDTSTRAVDGTTSASPYLLHEIAPKITGMSPLERQGESLFQGNCAFCHGADGTGKNWIGSFLEPHPRNLQDQLFMRKMTKARLTETIRNGISGTSMPAWGQVLATEQIQAVVAYISKVFYALPD